MLVNSNYRYGGGGTSSSLIIEGYYNDSKFYQDDSFSTEIEGESGKLYVDISTNKAYRWTGSMFTAFNSNNAEFSTNADSVNSLRTDVYSYISDIFSTTLSPSHSCWNKKYSVYGQSNDTNADLYLDNAPEISNAVWYEVETIGNGGRAYQIAHGCYSHQQKSFIRYMHDGVWSGWKNIADGGDADTVGGFETSRFIQWIGLQTDTTIISDPNYKIDYHCGISNGSIIGLPVSSWYHIIYYQHLNLDGFGMQIAYPLNHNGDIMTRHAEGFTWTEWKTILTSTGGTMTGALVAQSNTAYTTPQVRNATMSTSAPSGGSNGQIHYQYS